MPRKYSTLRFPRENGDLRSHEPRSGETPAAGEQVSFPVVAAGSLPEVPIWVDLPKLFADLDED
jgi:hypothetical protein